MPVLSGLLASSRPSWSNCLDDAPVTCWNALNSAVASGTSTTRGTSEQDAERREVVGRVRRSKTGARRRRGRIAGQLHPAAARSAATVCSARVGPRRSRAAAAGCPRNWRVPTRLNAILLIPVLVGLVLGGFQVKTRSTPGTRPRTREQHRRLVRAAADYGNALLDERDLTAAPLLDGRRNDPAVERGP